MKRPSPALVISCVALFASLGGTGYAAIQLRSGATDPSAKSKQKAKSHKTKPSKPLTAAQVNALIAKYLATHHIVAGKAGPAGSTGPGGKEGTGSNGGSQGNEGKSSPPSPSGQGHGDGLLAEGKSSEEVVGPWKLKFACESGVRGPLATVTLSGPGVEYLTVSTGEPEEEAETVNYNRNVEGSHYSIHGEHQMSIHGILASTTLEQIDIQAVSYKEEEGPNTCAILGTGAPTPL